MGDHFNVPNVFVQGGTNGGWRRPYAGQAPMWKCSCGAHVTGYWTTCPKCDLPRHHE